VITPQNSCCESSQNLPHKSKMADFDEIWHGLGFTFKSGD